MRYTITDQSYKFVTAFDTQSGAYVRTGILDDWGRDTGEDPFMASFPHLVDVGIMGHCIHGQTGLCVKAGIGCYQSGLTKEMPNMTLSDFEIIARQCSGKVHQFALGGRGDPDQHEHFEDILKLSRTYNIVPNFTTSGYGMTPELAKVCKRYCGAVAVSWYRSAYTLKALAMLLAAGVKTNIHYVLGQNSIDEALQRLRDKDFPRGINAVIFLLHKPAGQGSQDNVLSADDPRVQAFFTEIDKGNHGFKIGLDSCSVPGLINYSKKVAPETFDTCEGARFSSYIDAQMNFMPCSFDQAAEYVVSLLEMSIAEAWESDAFERFRVSLRHRCPMCDRREHCMGGCPLFSEIVLCMEHHAESSEGV